MFAGGSGHRRQTLAADAMVRWEMDENINRDVTTSTSNRHQSSSVCGALMEPRLGGPLRALASGGSSRRSCRDVLDHPSPLLLYYD